MSSIKRSVSIPEELASAIEQQASLQLRSFSQIIAIYMTSDVSIPMVAALADAEGVAAEVIGRAEHPGEIGKRVSPARKQRSGMCAHRIPPGSFCRVCDR